MSNAKNHQLLTIAEAATLLRLKQATLRAWVLHHRIAYVKLGRRVFIRRSDLDALVAASIVQAQPRERPNARPWR
jgi:excisionase family DNA binding protein